MSRPIRVIDRRNKHYFMVDDVYLNGYAKYLGPITSMTYISLCRHVSFEDQKAFPSQEQIATEIGAKKRSVINAIKTLKEWGLIEVERDRSANHGWSRNSYYLLDKAVWKKEPGATNALGRPGAKNNTDEVHVVHTKVTHTKVTHTLSIGDIGEKDFEEIATKYQVPVSFVRSKYDDMVLWAGEKPGSSKVRGRNWKLTLMKWVKTDAMKIKNTPRKGGMIYVEGQID